MNRPASLPPPLAPGRIPGPVVFALGLMLLAVHIGFFAWHTDRAARAFDACARPANTLPGMAEPRFFLDNDSYAWLSHARDLRAAGGWHLRRTFMDNAPYGREMRWSHLLIWTLQGMAKTIASVTGWSFPRALEIAGVWSMPLLQFLFLGVAFGLLFRKTGWIPAGLFCGLFLALDGLSYGFHPRQPDHHGLQVVASILSFLCLQLGGLGWIRCQPGPPPPGCPAFRPLAPPPRPEARRWFVASGFFGGLALWLGATVWLFALAPTAIAALTALPAFHRRADSDSDYHPELWRLWALAGSLFAGLFYLLEFAPDGCAMRLEVNHPLYWLCWLGVAECLRFAGTRTSLRLRPSLAVRDWLLAALGALAAGALPMLVWAGPADWHALRHPLLQRLHAGFIDEFRPAWTVIRSGPFEFFLVNMGLLPLLALGIPLWLFRSGSRAADARRTLLPALIFSAFLLFLLLFQLRWGILFTASLAWLATLFVSAGSGFPASRFAQGLAAVLLLNIVGADVSRLRTENAAAVADRIPPAWIKAALSKRLALQWGYAAGTNHWRMAGIAPEAPVFYYFTGIRSVASYYWENAAGWEAEAAFFADVPPDEDARRIARERGLTHVYARPADSLPRLYTTLRHGRTDPAALAASLAGRLAFPKNAKLPPWIRRDAALSAVTEKMYAFQTPAGLVGEKTVGQVYILRPDDKPGEQPAP